MARRLAAILVADVVGYSALMSEDEAGTLAALRAHRTEIFDPVIAERGGRLVKLMGDGALVEFSSVVDAVEAALAIQQQVAANEDCHIRLRIGVNLGDIIIDGDDIYGDGVNVAARLEALAEPGGICIASIVHESIGNRVEAEFANAGEHKVKGLPRPIRVWHWPAQGVAAGMAVPLVLPDKPSIAVLPFKNMSGDAEQSYLSDGITEDIITELSRFHRLSIISAASSSRYRDTADTLGEARNPGAQYLVDGSVRRLGSRLRITSKLSDATTGSQLWAERFDRDIEQIFAVQDEIVQRLVSTIVGRVQTAGAERARRKLPTSLGAYECVQRAKAYQIGDPDAEAEARRLYERAIELDPGYALAHSHLAHMLSLAWLRDESDSDELLDQAFELSKHSVALDANEPNCQNTLGWVHLYRRSFDLAEQYYRRALELNPNDAEQVAYMGVLHAYFGNLDESLTSFRQ